MEIKQFEDTLKQLEYISKAVGIPVDYTQVGGGNTSAKLDSELMAVKASGCKLKQMTVDEGYVVVDYKKIRDYHMNVDLSEGRDLEKESGEFVRSNVIDVEGLKKLRPSVEAGFHSVLKKYVIHTHSVYANILCCTMEGSRKVEEIFGGKEYAAAWIPYINPGFKLTLGINGAIRESMNKSGRFPAVFFMENHGLIVNCDDSRECVELHQQVNDTIREHLGIKDAFPEIELFNVDENTQISKTQFPAGFFSGLTADYFDRNVLYPDQLVYLNGNISVGGISNKLNINEAGERIYKCGLDEARSIEETLLAYAYVIENIRKAGLRLKAMSDKSTQFIRNWESEAYRKSLAK